LQLFIWQIWSARFCRRADTRTPKDLLHSKVGAGKRITW
jgi:hypothetical protein